MILGLGSILNVVEYGTAREIVLYALLVVLLFLLAWSMYQSRVSKKMANKAKVELAASYVDLKKAYDEVSSTKTELYDRYKELKESREHMKEVAYTDYLTDLPNRVSFMEMLEKEMLKTYPGEYVALIDLDLDDFKVINDSFGHLSGDAVVSSVANRLRVLASKEDLIGRVGGDEFIFLFNHLKAREDCENKAVELMQLFSSEQFAALDDVKVKLAASMGVVIVRRDSCQNVQNLMRDLDMALFVAKDSGKNTYKIFDYSMEEMMMNKVKLQADIREAIDENQFELFYQPQVNLNTNKVGSFEALVRWHHPQKGLITPSEFIPIAEESGLIIEIGKMVLSKACCQLSAWHAQGHKVMVAVNLSAKQFRDPFFIDFVEEMIEEYNVDPSYLELEITETVALDDINYAIRTLKRLRAIGISFSLDDFGTGYSSLNYLRQLPVDNLKIDKSFMDNITYDTSDKKIVETIITLAQALDLVVVAEGVEEQNQEDLLRRMNCNKAQGYLYSRPVPAGVASRMIA